MERSAILHFYYHLLKHFTLRNRKGKKFRRELLDFSTLSEPLRFLRLCSKKA
jgi:hypothetical protein